MKYFKDKTAEQTFSLCLLLSCVALMLFCAIVRLCGGLWFAADLDGVPLPNEFWQEMIMALLLAFELVFVYKILCRTQWVVCIIISVLEALIGILKGVGDLAYQTALKLAQTELEHVDAWHTVAVKAIEAKRAEMKAKGQEVPAYMQTMWDDEHAEYVEKVAKLKYKLETAKK